MGIQHEVLTAAGTAGKQGQRECPRTDSHWCNRDGKDLDWGWIHDRNGFILK
jgi:hypothetical protein